MMIDGKDIEKDVRISVEDGNSKKKKVARRRFSHVKCIEILIYLNV
jgi:hypothetical protein